MRAPSRAIRMAVMPTLSRNVWLALAARLWELVREYFVTGPARGAVVLSFRRQGLQAGGFRRWVQEDGGKKASGSILWSGAQEATPREGGSR